MKTFLPVNQPDRLLTITMGVSLAGHVVAIAVFLLTSGWKGWARTAGPVKIVYESEGPADQVPWTHEVTRIQVGLRQAPPPSAVLPEQSMGEGFELGPLGPDVSSLAADNEVGGGGLVMWGEAGSEGEAGSSWSSAIDLNDLTGMFQSNPVLYSYFSAIRERIQAAANQEAWQPMDPSAAGIVYVGFVLNRSGAIESADVLEDRSAGSEALRDVALRIVSASGPFLPFPPSFPESSKAIVVPIEFASAL
jgi:hypothetical protein